VFYLDWAKTYGDVNLTSTQQIMLFCATWDWATKTYVDIDLTSAQQSSVVICVTWIGQNLC
jgi:hypothetical protein